MITAQCLGVDISGKDFRVCLQVKNQDKAEKIKGSRKFDNTPKGFASLHDWLEKRVDKQVPLTVVMEATGVYYERLAFALHELGYQLHVLLPNRVKHYMKFLNLKSKTDKLEAQALAQLGLHQALPKWQPASAQMYRLKRLSRERNSLLEEKTMVANRVHAEQACQWPDKTSVKRQHQRLRLLDKQIKQVEEQMQQCAAQDQELQQQVDNICRIKGVAWLTVLTLIAETNGFANVEHKSQLVSYAGYDVVERQSGSTLKGKTRISKQGNKHIRNALHFPALNVVKYHAEFKALQQRIYERTRVKMKGYVAVQRKLLVLIYTLYKNKQAYDPNYYRQHLLEQSRQDTTPAYTG